METEKNNLKLEKRIQHLREMLNIFQNKKASCSALDTEVSDINQHIEVETPLHFYLLHFTCWETETVVIFAQYYLDFQQRIDLLPTKS